MQSSRVGDVPFRLAEVNSNEVLDQIYELRVRAWRTRLSVPVEVTVWHDSFDDDARHWAFFDGERPVAAGRLTISARLDQVPDAEVYKDVLPGDLPGPIASLTRLVVDPDYRGRGLTRPLDAVRIAAAQGAGCLCAIGAVHETSRLRQLQSVGFDVRAPHHPNAIGAEIIAGTLPLAIVILRLQQVSNFPPPRHNTDRIDLRRVRTEICQPVPGPTDLRLFPKISRAVAILRPARRCSATLTGRAANRPGANGLWVPRARKPDAHRAGGRCDMCPSPPAGIPLRLASVTEPEILQQIYRLRVEAWRTKLDLPADVVVWHDRFDPIAQHWAFFDGGRPVAAGRLTISARLSNVPDADVYWSCPYQAGHAEG